jgi:hypothetical protein
VDKQFLKGGGEFRKCKAKTLFQIKGNPQLDKDSFVFDRNSTYPYFTRTVFNNGILGYVNYLDDEHLIKGNSLAVGMIGMQFFYMKHDFYAGQFTKTAFPKFDGFNEHIALWFISWLNKSSQKYQSVLVRDFENTFNETELIVPYKDDKVAVDYIEKHVRKLEEERLQELGTYLQEAGFEDCTLSEKEEKALNCLPFITMKEIAIGDLFEIRKGKRLTKANMRAGNINFIGATADNNGVTNRISNDSQVHPSNTITVTYNGSVGEAFYQTNPYWASDDVNVLYSKGTLNENLALFYLAPIRKKGKGYAYSFKWTKEKMAKDSIWIPCRIVDGVTVCDYTFMETYINAIKKQCIASLKKTIGQEHKAVKKSSIFQDYNESYIPLMAAEGIYIYGSIPVDLPNTNRNELIDENLDLILMYAIPPNGRQKAEAAKKIAIGIKESMLSDEQVASYKSVKHIMFHYWSNPKAYHITKEPLLVDRDEVPSDYTIRMEKDAVKFLLLEYDLQNPSELGSIDILKTQRRGEIRYLPFVTTIDSIRMD